MHQEVVCPRYDPLSQAFDSIIDTRTLSEATEAAGPVENETLNVHGFYPPSPLPPTPQTPKLSVPRPTSGRTKAGLSLHNIQGRIGEHEPILTLYRLEAENGRLERLRDWHVRCFFFLFGEIGAATNPELTIKPATPKTIFHPTNLKTPKPQQTLYTQSGHAALNPTPALNVCSIEPEELKPHGETQQQCIHVFLALKFLLMGFPDRVGMLEVI